MADNKFTVNAQFEGVTDKERPTDSAVYAFDAKGNFLASAPLDAKGQAQLALATESTGQAVRLFIGPRLEKDVKPTPALLQRYGALEDRRLLNPTSAAKVQLTIPSPIWKRWPFCFCVVRGRVVKRQPQPDGSTRDLPVCNTRVTICEVDMLPNIILRLPDPVAFRLRDELVREITRPLPVLRPIPPIPPLPDPPPILRLSPGTAGIAGGGLKASTTPQPDVLAGAAANLPTFDVKTLMSVRALASTVSVAELRPRLADLHLIIRPFLCLWDWLHPFFATRVDCLRTVPVNENGQFQTILTYLCAGDKPDLYFKVEQLQGGVWKTIYAPSVACHTHWNFNCGSEVTIVITDPSAIACVPQDPVVTGETTWVMPYAVGGSPITGSPTPAPAAASNGWVRTDGFTNYGGITDAPFGSLLGFRMGYSNNITGSATIKFFRWSYRKVGTAEWSQMNLPVSRHYVKTVPGAPNPIISFPTYQLGPRTIGTQQNLYEFKPAAPPAPAPPDPPLTTTAWPIDNWFDDIYAAFLDTLSLPGMRQESAGQYQIKLEVFGPDGALLSPTGPFRFIVPSSIDSNNTVNTRPATPGEIDGSGFVFNLQIDNNVCEAAIYPTSIGTSAVADGCGFLRYTPGVGQFTLAFTARHPNNRAYFDFSVVRGMTGVAAASVSNAEVGANAGPYTRDANSRFSHPFNQPELLEGCVNAAFAESLGVYAKVTNGWGRIGTGYDRSALAAFALATP